MGVSGQPETMRGRAAIRVLKSRAGLALLEVLMAGAVVALLMAGLFTLNTFNIKTMRSGKETVAASLVIQERLDQLRKGTWMDITDPAYLQSVLGSRVSSPVALSGLSERVTINVYPAGVIASVPIQVTRSADGTVAVASSNTALRSKPMVRADVTVTWIGSRTGAPRTRTISTVIANGGIVK